MPTECAESGCPNKTDSGICPECAAEQKYGTTSRAYDADGSRVELREGETRDDPGHSSTVNETLANADAADLETAGIDPGDVKDEDDAGLERFDQVILEDDGDSTIMSVAERLECDDALRLTESQAEAILEYDRAITVSWKGQKVALEVVPDDPRHAPVEIREADTEIDTSRPDHYPDCDRCYDGDVVEAPEAGYWVCRSCGARGSGTEEPIWWHNDPDSQWYVEDDEDDDGPIGTTCSDCGADVVVCEDGTVIEPRDMDDLPSGAVDPINLAFKPHECDEREVATDGGQSQNGSERFEYECVYTGGNTYQNILDGLADDGWRFVESIEEDEIFVFERPARPQDTESTEAHQ